MGERASKHENMGYLLDMLENRLLLINWRCDKTASYHESQNSQSSVRQCNAMWLPSVSQTATTALAHTILIDLIPAQMLSNVC